MKWNWKRRRHGDPLELVPIPRLSQGGRSTPWEAWNGCLREADRSCRAAANSTKGTVIGRCVGRNFCFEVTDLLDHERKEICAFRTAVPCSNHRPNSLTPNTHPHAERASNMTVLETYKFIMLIRSPMFHATGFSRCRFVVDEKWSTQTVISIFFQAPRTDFFDNLFVGADAEVRPAVTNPPPPRQRLRSCISHLFMHSCGSR